MSSFPQTGFKLFKDDNYILVSLDWTEKFIRSYGQDEIFIPWQVRKNEDLNTLPKAIIYDMVDYFAGAQWEYADVGGPYIDIYYKDKTSIVHGVHIAFLKFPFRWVTSGQYAVDKVIDDMRPKTKVTKPTFVKHSDGSYMTVNRSRAVNLLNAVITTWRFTRQCQFPDAEPVKNKPSLANMVSPSDQQRSGKDMT